MTDLCLDTGSIDIVRTTDGRYVFLEVNPVGQFGMVSVPCNYNLELKVAKYLANSHYAAA
jgi:glutathione synthase/RimK-type ligase-like ATP-grasp enzyme